MIGVGIDVSKLKSTICITNEYGEVLKATNPECHPTLYSGITYYRIISTTRKLLISLNNIISGILSGVFTKISENILETINEN